jgi:hypothetical protein
MLFDLSNNTPVDVPEWAEQEMRNDFPYFFNEKRPVVLRVKDRYKVRSYKVPTNNTDAEPILMVQSPGAFSIKTKGNFYDKEGETEYTLLYTTSAPTNISGVYKYNSSRISIGDGFTIQPHQKDLLFYLQYICPMIDGNKALYKSGNKRFVYEKKDVVATSKISAAKAARELENLIYFDTDYKTILKAVEGLGMKVLFTEDETRVALHDAIKNGSDTFKKNAFEIIGSSKPQQTKSSEEESVHELVNRLINENYIKNEDGMWYIRDRRGDGTKWLKTPFFESAQTGSEAAFALIDHLKVNEELLGKLRKL